MQKSKNFKGFSLVEILFVVAFISIAFLAMIRGYLGIGEGLLISKNKTTAINFAKEKIDVLKSIDYNHLYVTTDDDWNEGEGDDNTYYRPETYTVGGKDFTRYVAIRKVRDSGGSLEDMSEDDTSEGLKRIRVTVRWTEKGVTKEKILYNLKEDPDRVPLNGTIEGRVVSDMAVPLTGAMVYVVENQNWDATTDTNGEFEIKTSTGSWNLRATYARYFPAESGPYTVSEGESTPAGDIELTKMGMGSVYGLVKTTDNVYIEGAIITCDDETSGFAVSRTTTAYGNPEKNFILGHVSTGTWTIFATTGPPTDLSGDTTGVILVNDGDIVKYHIELDTWVTTGSISGKVYMDDVGSHEGIKVSGEVAEDDTAASGEYRLEAVSEGAVTVTANPGAFNPSYTTETTTVTVIAGQNTSADTIIIYPVGAVSGKVEVLSGDPLPGIVIRAVSQIVGIGEKGIAMSDENGDYIILQLPLYGNDYTIQPVLEEEDISTPEGDYTDITVTKGGNETGKDFTITQAWGYISGNVKDNNEPITTGVIIIASVDVIADPSDPPDMSLGETDKYGGISYSEGRYELKVRTGDTYNVYAWYTEINGNGTVTAPLGPEPADLITGTTAQINFNWP